MIGPFCKLQYSGNKRPDAHIERAAGAVTALLISSVRERPVTSVTTAFYTASGEGRVEGQLRRVSHTVVLTTRADLSMQRGGSPIQIQAPVFGFKCRPVV